MKRLMTLCLLLSWVCVLATGCRPPYVPEEKLPLPPVGDSGLQNGVYHQTEYGFALPVPKGYGIFAPNQEDLNAAEFDEWVRLMDAKRDYTIRVMTQETEVGRRFSESEMKKSIEAVFASGQYEVLKTGKTLTWPVDKAHWTVIPYDLKDKGKKELRVWVCAIPRKDFVLWARGTVTGSTPPAGAEEKLLTALKGSLTGVKWYMPIGARGISLQFYELQKFDADLLKALESGVVAKTLRFFDETSPIRFQWADRYRKIVAPAEGKGNTAVVLKVKDAGLVINGKKAAIYYDLQNGDQAPVRVGFRLTKEDRAWNIVGLEKTDKK